MIEFENVQLLRGDRAVIDGMSLSIERNERVAVLGGSGSGKTTILKLILGLLQADEGKVIVDGRDITNLKEEELRDTRLKFSLTFQDGALFDSLTVKENVAFFIREYMQIDEDEIEKRVRDRLREVDVEEAIYMMPEELSGGMKRRVAIARSLAAHEPAMFLYDEPTSDLDPVNAGKIRKLIQDLSSGGRGFILVTHEMVDALKVAERLIFIKGGKVLFDGDRDSFQRTDIQEIQAFLREARA